MSTPRLTVGPLTVDVWARKAVLEGEELNLTRLEFNLLTLLATHPTRVFTRQSIVDTVWGGSRRGGRAVDSTAVRLRKKLGGGVWLINVWGVGYKLLDLPLPMDGPRCPLCGGEMKGEMDASHNQHAVE